MAVYTDVSDAALDAFLADYDLGQVLSLKGIAEGVENTNFFLQTAAGRFILTLYEKRVAASDLPFFMAVLDHMSAAGVNCPAPVHGRDGAAVRVLAGRPAAIFTFLDGVSPRQPSVAQCAEAGAALAFLHRAADGFTLRRPNALGPDGWPRLATATRPRADEVEPGLANTIADELAFLRGSWPRHLPEGVIHADLYPDNSLFVGETLTGVIDFYFACTDTFAYDVAVTLNAWCFSADGVFDPARSAALLQAYAAGRTPSDAEREALPVLARGAALRFMLTRLHDWLHRDPGALVRPKDPLECLRQLRFHRTVTDVATYGL